jgi:hypothetical protein
MKKLFYVIAVTVLFLGCEGKEGAPGPAGVQGPEGPQGPKGDPGTSLIVTSTWTFNRNIVTKSVPSLANIQIPAEHIKQPPGFTGLFMAYVTPLDFNFGGYSAGVVLPLPHTYLDGGITSVANVYRTSHNSYYLSFTTMSTTGSPSDFAYLDSGRFALQLVWAPAATARIASNDIGIKGLRFVNGEVVDQD